MIALITGAAGGIGSAIARKLGAERIAVVLLANQSMVQAESIAAEIRQDGGKAISVQCDVTNNAEVENAIAAVVASFGIPSILVNNAGVGGPFHPLDQVSEAEWDWIIDTNVKSMFLFARLLLPMMKANGYGRIVNISSIYGLLGGAQSAVYSASKHAILGLTKSIAAEWGEFGITCNAVCPGFVETVMGVQDQAVHNHLGRILHKSPVKRIAQPEEIAALVNHLIGSTGSFINGATLTIDGGITAHLGV
jgi:3-oxoacyl-[acyl-carrier protein] reductase